MTLPVPFFFGAVEIWKEINLHDWNRLCKGVTLPAQMERIIDPTCRYFGISQPQFAHFFVPGGQIPDYTPLLLNRESTCSDIASVIFDFVIYKKTGEIGLVNTFEYIRQN